MTSPIGQFVDTTAGRTSTNPFITLIMNRAPTGNDGINNNLLVGQRWIDTSNENEEYFLLNFTASGGVIQANWIELGGSIAAETLTGNSGGPVGPDIHGNINVVGDGTTVNIVGNPATNTLTASVVGSGVLQTLSDDVGTSITPSAGNIQLVGHINEQGSTKFSTVVAGTHLANINPMSSARWIVDPLGFNGTHTTIGAALTSSTSGDTIWLLPGTYTENLTLKAGVNICANTADAFTPNVIINGKCTFTGAGSVVISGINLKTNSDYFLVVSGSSASNISFYNSYFNCLNHTGIDFTSSSGGANINIFQSSGNLATTAITLFVHTSAGNINVTNSKQFSNTGGSTLASICTSGSLNIDNSYFTFPLGYSTTGGGTIERISMDTSGIATTPLSFAGSGSLYLAHSRIVSLGATGITVATGCTVGIYENFLNSNADSVIQITSTGVGVVAANVVSSSATDVFTGSGTIYTGGNVFTNSHGNNVTTSNSLTVG